MSMDLRGERTRLWVNVHQTRDGGTFNTYAIGLSKKREDGTYMNCSIKAMFTKKVNVPSDVKSGEFISYEGFMTVEEYQDKTGKSVTKPMIVITKADFEDREYNPVNDPSVEIPEDYMPQDFSYSDSDIPF